MIGFLWAAPVMTTAHLFLAVMTTLYMLVAIRFEEADLIAVHGDTYQRYREQVPMLKPALAATKQAQDRKPAAAN